MSTVIRKKPWLVGVALILLAIGIAPILIASTAIPTAGPADLVLASDIEKLLATDTLTADSQISVDVDLAVVTLVGQVDDYKTLEKARQLASEPQGVRRVVTNLTVRTGSLLPSFDDAAISDQISELLATDRLTAGHQLQASVEGGVVTLSGLAPNSEVKRRALALALSVGGASHASSQILVSSWS